MLTIGILVLFGAILFAAVYLAVFVLRDTRRSVTSRVLMATSVVVIACVLLVVMLPAIGCMLAYFLYVHHLASGAC